MPSHAGAGGRGVNLGPTSGLGGLEALGEARHGVSPRPLQVRPQVRAVSAQPDSMSRNELLRELFRLVDEMEEPFRRLSAVTLHLADRERQEGLRPAERQGCEHPVAVLRNFREGAWVYCEPCHLWFVVQEGR